ncbi:hypothetical protein BVC71_08380 [Marivivens niveibacter]|uniref:N-acetyltransferase domain-containing protein n=1 Tax=Marivivens niveibacter TaxID=1930667 RepID=A0A251X054_9RHOB|nr:GNAT family N-acetyltransferase [Marivivens niveibacter]OUD09941.1 hypothetical protein BVC71_08380 [Marivivens niveibacter]
MTFDTQPSISGYGYRIDPLREEDREALYQAASDPLTWAGHPATTRHQRPNFDRYFDDNLSSKQTVVLRNDAGTVIGCSRYYPAPDVENSISIGYTFIDCKFWGGDTNYAFKRLMLEHAFKTYDEVWFHIAPSNIRSQKGTGKLGAVWRYDASLGLMGTPPEDWKCYTISKEAWENTVNQRENASQAQ